MSRLILIWQEGYETRAETIEISAGSKADPIRLGRDPSLCDIVFSDPRISRVQAEINWDQREGRFYLQNLRQQNPIFVENQPLIGSTALDNNAVISIGKTQVQVNLLEDLAIATAESSLGKGDYPSSDELTSVAKSSSIRYSQLIPLSFLHKGSEWQHYLIPGTLTVILVVLLFGNLGNASLFNYLLAVYLGSCGFFIIYRLCDKPKPWWLIALLIVVTPLLLFTPIWLIIEFVFRDLLPGRVSDQKLDPISSFIAYFFGAGLAEELLLTWQ